MQSFLRKLVRRQTNEPLNSVNNSDEIEPSDANGEELDRHLSLIALTCLSISNSIGSGIYVLTGLASNPYAGPYVLISYVLSGLACLLAAFCYAEFSSRVKSCSGSSYSYIYNIIGEFVAFCTGYMVFISALASFSATSITWSQYLDSATNNTIRNFINNTLHATWNLGPIFSSYLDISAIVITVFMFIISLIGIKVAALFNNMLAALNITLLIVITISGFIYGNFENLTKTKYENGVYGIIKGASIVMYAFTGFESSTFAIDEAINPRRNAPLSLIISVSVITLSYCGAAFSLNMMVPFDQIDKEASYPSAFKSVHWVFLVVTIGPILSLSGSLFTGIYSTVRIAYFMAKDGLLFKFLSSINHTTKVPNPATFLSLFISLLLTIAINIKDLIGFANVVCFLVYSLVAKCLLIVRYYDPDNEITSLEERSRLLNENQNEDQISDVLTSVRSYQRPNLFTWIKQYMNGETNFQKDLSTRRFFRNKKNAVLIISLIFFSNMFFSGLLNNLNVAQNVIVILTLITNAVLSFILSLFQQNKSQDSMSFRVPLVPFVPVLVIVLNNYLMMACEPKEWYIFLAILTLGLPVYFFYGIKHSKLN